MKVVPESATYNLKAVVTETGLKADTLRAWERRYGLPQPDRSQGGHRLYSRRDVDTVLWLVARQNEGLGISRAVALWESLVASGQDPLASPSVAAAARKTPLDLAPGYPVANLRQSWVDACMAFDEAQARQVLDQAFALYAPEHVCFEVLQKGLAQIGQGWYEGRVTVQQEHFASALAERRLDALLMAAPPPTRPGRILIGCPPGERHTFSPLLLALLLRRQGREALYLGVNVPVEQMSQTIRSTHTDLLILSAQQLHTAASLLDVAEETSAAGLALAYGGLVFNLLPGLRGRIPGYFLGERLDDAPQTVARLLSGQPPTPRVAGLSPAQRATLETYSERYPLVEAATWQACAPLNLPPGQLAQANKALAQNIIAALKFGDIYLAGNDVAWLQGLLFNRKVPAAAFHHYLQAYVSAAESNLQEGGRPIISWLRGLLAEVELAQDGRTGDGASADASGRAGRLSLPRHRQPEPAR